MLVIAGMYLLHLTTDAVTATLITAGLLLLGAAALQRRVAPRPKDAPAAS